MTPDLFWITGPWHGRLAISTRPRGGEWLEDEIRGWRRAHLDSVVSEAYGIRFIVSVLRSVNRALEQGENVAVHCRQGIGRAALFAAGALMVAGKPPESALEAVRLARGLNVPETQEQREWIQRDLADSLATVHQ